MKRRNWFDVVWEDLDLNLEEPLDGWKDGMGREGERRSIYDIVLQ